MGEEKTLDSEHFEWWNNWKIRDLVNCVKPRGILEEKSSYLWN